MRLDVVRTVFRKELREMLRDRRSLAVMFGIPLLLYPLVAIGVATLGSAKTKELRGQEVRVYIPGGKESVPKLIGLMNDQYTGLTAVDLNPEIEPIGALKAGTLQAIVDAPPNAEARMVAGEDVQLTVRVDRSRTATPFAERKFDEMLGKYKKWIVEQRLALRGVPATVLEQPKTATVDISSGTQRFGKMLAQMLPLLLLMTGMLGALFPALNATTTERELGTLETLLVTPAGRTELLVAKGALVLICGLLTAGLNMVSMSLVLKRATSMIDAASAADFSVSAGALAISYLAAVPTLILFTTLVLIMGLLARNFREANAYATPVMLLPLASLAVGIMEPAATPAVLITPIANTTVIIRDALTGRVGVGAFLLAFASSAVYAGLMLGVAARLFSNEQLVNPAWEPLSMKGLRFGPGAAGKRKPRRLPGPDEAIFLFGVSLLLLFYIPPSLRHLGLLPIVAVNQLLLVLAPALLFAYFGRWKWRETFRWNRAAPPTLLGAALVGIGLMPWAHLLSAGQNAVWPRETDESMRATAELILNALVKHPAVTILTVAVLAGICEEILFRGPIQTALARKLPPWAAIGATAFLFAVAHLGDFHGIPLRMLLGVALGYVVWRGGSLLPAVLAHGFYDAAALTYGWWMIRTRGATTAAATEPAFRFDAQTITMLAVGAGLALAGVALMRIGWGRPPAAETEAEGPAVRVVQRGRSTP